MKYVIGLDIGTSGTKAILVNEQGNVINSVHETYGFTMLKDGWCEQDPQLWWDAVKKVLIELLQNFDKADIRAISMSGQMHSTVFVDKQGMVIRPAILWNDTRTSEECSAIDELIGKERLLDQVSNIALEGFSAGKILWIKKYEPENYQRIHKILMPKDYIGYCLTTNYYTDKSDASGTLLMDVKKGTWCIEIIEKLGLDVDAFPEIVDATSVIGTLQKEIALELGLSPTCMVIAGGADNACAALGTGILHDRDSLISIGTSGTIISFIEDKHIQVDGSYHLFAHCISNALYKMSVMLSSGLSFRWVRNQMLESNCTYNELCRRANATKPGSHGVYFLPYLCGERCPHPNAAAKGSFIGIVATTSQDDLIRSVLEGVGYGFRECIEVMDKDKEIKRYKVTGGGAKSSIWLQMIADIIGCELELVEVVEGPAYGAALLAGIGSGIFRDVEAICSRYVAKGKVYYPNLENKKIYDKHFEVYKKLYTCLLPAYQAMKKIKEKEEIIRC